ncbi:MAG: tripartite tricarboxylate transporter substrate binding protein [Burkholderiales bacterium]
MAKRLFWTVACALLGVGNAFSQAGYPEKSIRIIVAYPSGGSPDFVARLLGQKLSAAWGKPIVIDNLPGASGSIGADRVAKATPDGYTLGFLAIPEVAINPSLFKLAYDPLKDFSPVSQVTRGLNILVVNNALPVKTVQELVKLAKARPGEITFASSGTGTTPHLSGALFKSAARIDIQHVPYKGVVVAIPDLVAGRVAMAFTQPSFVVPMVSDGKLRALAVTSLKRHAAFPQVPTIAESGYPGFEVVGFQGLLAPAGTPAAIVSKLHLETVKALESDMRAKLADSGSEAAGSKSPAEFAALIKSEVPRWAKVIKDAGIKVD